jgi:hypothetical protein
MNKTYERFNTNSSNEREIGMCTFYCEILWTLLKLIPV